MSRVLNDVTISALLEGSGDEGDEAEEDQYQPSYEREDTSESSEDEAVSDDDNIPLASPQIEGILAPVFTPCREDGLTNLAVIPEYMQFLADNSVHGILVGGTTGEAVTLSLEERKLSLEAWLEAAKPLNMKVIAQVGGVPLPEVLELARHAEKHAANAIMTLPEMYYRPKTPEQLVNYLELVSNVAPSLPLLYYHFPMMSGVDVDARGSTRVDIVSMTGFEGAQCASRKRLASVGMEFPLDPLETMSDLVNMRQFFSLATSRVPNFKGMKADLGVAVQVAELLKEDQRIFNANHMLAPAVLLGHESSIATVTNMFPGLVCDLVEATKRGDVPLVRTLQGKLNRLVEGIASQGEFLPTMKAAMPMVTGIKVGPPRRPNIAVDMEKRDKIQENLAEMGMKIFS